MSDLNKLMKEVKSAEEELKIAQKQLREHRQYRMIQHHADKIIPTERQVKALKQKKANANKRLLAKQKEIKQRKKGPQVKKARSRHKKQRLSKMTKKQRDAHTDTTQKERREAKQRRALMKGPTGEEDDPVYTRNAGQRGKYNKSKAKKLKEKEEAIARSEQALKRLLPKNMGGSIYDEKDSFASKERKRRGGTALDRAFGSNVGLTGSLQDPSVSKLPQQGVKKDEGPLPIFDPESAPAGTRIKVIKQGQLEGKEEDLTRREKIAYILDIYADDLVKIREKLFRSFGRDGRIIGDADLEKMARDELVKKHLSSLGFIQGGPGVDAVAQTEDINKAKAKAPPGMRRVSNIPGQEFVRDDISKASTELRKVKGPSKALERLAKMKSDKEKFEKRNRIRYAPSDEDLRVRAYNNRYAKNQTRATSNIGGEIVATPRLLFDRDKDTPEIYDDRGRPSKISPLQAVEKLPFQDTQREAFAKLKENRRKGKIKRQAGIDSFLGDVIAGAERRIEFPEPEKSPFYADYVESPEPAPIPQGEDNPMFQQPIPDVGIRPPEFKDVREGLDELQSKIGQPQTTEAVSSDLSQLQERLEEKQRKQDEEDKLEFLSGIDEAPTDEDDFESDVPQLIFPSPAQVRNKMKQRAVKQIQGEVSKQRVRSLTKAREYFQNPGYYLSKEPGPQSIQETILFKELEEAKRKAEAKAERTNPFRKRPVLRLPQREPVAKGKLRRRLDLKGKETEVPPKPPPLSEGFRGFQSKETETAPKPQPLSLATEIDEEGFPIQQRPQITQKRYSTNPAQRSISEFFTKEKQAQAIKDGEQLRELKKKLVLETGYKMKFLAGVTIDNAQPQIREAFKEYLINEVGVSEQGAQSDVNQYLEPIFEVATRVRKAKQRTPKTNRRKGRRKK